MTSLLKIENLHVNVEETPILKGVNLEVKAGEIHAYAPFFFQVCGERPEIIAQALVQLTDRGKVPEALRLAHLIGAAVAGGESSSQA